MGYYCGIDLGNKESVICVLDGRRQVMLDESVKTEAAAIKKVLKKYRGLTCVVEASPLAEWVSEVVETLGHKVTVVCPRKTKAILSAQSPRKKTDKRDARGLAELAKSGWYEAVHRKSAEARELRSYMTARKQLVQTQIALSSSIRGILRAQGVKFDARGEEEDFVMQTRRIMKTQPPLVQEAIVALLKAYELTSTQSRAMYKKLQGTARDAEVTRLLMTMPSIGAATASAFVATIDDPARFPDGERVAAYLGLTASVYQSGESEIRGRITKTGDKMLRWYLVEAAHNLLTRSKISCELKAWGLRLKEKKGLGKARVAVARRMAVILWSMWMYKQEFLPESLAAAA